MSLLHAVQVPRLPVSRLEPVISALRYAELARAADQVRPVLAGRTIWNVNSTAAGGGVAEMLQVLVGYVQDLGIPTGWLVITGDAEFSPSPSGCTTRSTAACPVPRSARRKPTITRRCWPRTRWSWPPGSGPAMWCCCTTLPSGFGAAREGRRPIVAS